MYYKIIYTDIKFISKWVRCNKLSLYVSRACFMITHPLMTNAPQITIIINESPLKESEEYKFLGVIINKKLLWKSHIYDLCTKISKLSGVLCKIRHCISTTCVRLLYLSLPHQDLLYFTAVWGGAYKTYMDRLFLSQKKLIRKIFHKSRFEHTNSLFHDYKKLKLSDILLWQSWLFVYKSLDTYSVNNDFQCIANDSNTRRHSYLKIPQSRTSQPQNNITSREIGNWNILPESIRNATSLNSLKYELKKYSLSNYL